MRVSESPSPLVRVACVVAGLAVLAVAVVAGLDLAGGRTAAVVVTVDAIGDGIDGTPIHFDVPEGWVRADPGVETGDIRGASRAALSLLDDRRRAAEARGVSALMFDLDSLGHMEVTHAVVDEPVEAAAQAVVDRQQELEAIDGVEVLQVREVELADRSGHLIRFVVGSGDATNHRLQVIVPYDEGYAVFSAQSNDVAALDDVVAIAPSIRIG